MPPLSCSQCRDNEPLGFQFSYAFQPILNVANREVFAHEALVRGERGESAYSVLARVNDDNRYQFDQSCRVRAIQIASQLGMASRLSINFLPNAIYKPELCIRTTLEAAKSFDFPIDQIIFETVEGEEVEDGKWLAEILREYKRIGFTTAIDDFGAGFAGLNLLADYQPDIIKLDMDLIRNVHESRPRQAIIKGVERMVEELGIVMIAEGVETYEEYRCLSDLGISLMQGYYFSKPLFEAKASEADIPWPDCAGS
ncbi:EAL domain-containing protein [Neopusillimonas maritima]|jgi:EAL domain-containing protein (putative c-di-GMP-specific phosphodiesterase class I)|uniref:Diguanylate phosphodiesterase n=1 Tax=Neopusillimonas maritima TaxID=2026239 RepID=A0ABX9MW98_9BURK|nr:EAL domain-containing protein [Neopusillimonas maritima]RII83103.1 diguanylate phosphodiesterase [Neopusillimonas maritima]